MRAITAVASVSAFRGVIAEVGKGRTVSSEDVEEVKEVRIFNVTAVLCSSLLESGAVYDPSLAWGWGDIRVSSGGAEGVLTNGSWTKSLRPSRTVG